jgi:alkanesulfonate monooxygenase SsuD/methylene tetrahydromethanopterin reductase-like flavin-dependent oxidoreductase (luciferase family)
VTVPPVIVGGLSGRAFDRAVAHGDGVFLIGSPEQIAADRARLAARAAAAGRPVPAVTANAMLVLAGDETLPEPAEIARQIADPDGMFGFPAEAAAGAARVTGAAAAAAYLSRLEEAGTERAVVTFPAGDWYRQASLLAEAAGTVSAQKAG